MNEGGSVHKTVDEWRVRVLKKLLVLPGNGGRLSPIVILHRDHENGLDLLGADAGIAQRGQENKHAQNVETSDPRHRHLQKADLTRTAEHASGHTK